MWKSGIMLFMLSATLWMCGGQKELVSEPSLPSDLRIISREEWGWQTYSDTLPEHQIRYITLHHGGEDFPADKDPVQYLRNLQAWSRAEKHWIDIPYHFMIDLQGRIYATRPLRYPGDTNTTYDPRGHALICVMGNYENQILSPAQLESVVALSAKLCRDHDVPPERIRGHKDYAETACPGQDFYRYIEDGTIERMVRERLGND